MKHLLVYKDRVQGLLVNFWNIKESTENKVSNKFWIAYLLMWLEQLLLIVNKSLLLVYDPNLFFQIYVSWKFFFL